MENKIADMTGEMIKHFKILGPLGKGGMGEVFLAEDTILQRKVAIKFLPQDLQDDLKSRERFLREALSAAALDHPYICKIYETGEINEKAYIIMEFLQGKDLRAQMNEEPLPLKETLRIVQEIAEALAKAHANGIVHRDLKPGNIMITPDGHVKVMDFGLAKKVSAEEKEATKEFSLAELNLDETDSDFSQEVTIADSKAEKEDTDEEEVKPEKKPDLEERDISQDVTIAAPPPKKDSELDLESPDISQDVTLATPAPEKKKVAKQDSELKDDLEGLDFSQEATIVSPSMEDQLELTEQGQIVGTVAYMSPEQARGEEVDGRSDIFSLGVILYELISQKHPFLRKTPVETLKSVITAPPPPLKTSQKRISSAASPILNKALNKKIKDRYQSIDEFIKDIEKMQKKPGIGAPLYYLRWQAIAGLVALFSVIVVGTWWFTSRAREFIPEPISVLVADFQNLTGDSVFDGALEQAMDIGLEGASFISVYDRPEARKIAREVYPDEGDRLDTQMAQLISAREGIDKFIEGSISPRDSGFTMTVTVRDPVNPDQVKEYSKRINSKDDVLNAAAWMANKVRSSLGDISADARAAFQGETYTTSSLEAMNAYQNAQELYREGSDEESINEYLNAIADDPDFGRAYSALAMVYQNRGQYDEADKYFQEALSRIDRMTEREKLRTYVVYYLVNRNFQQAISEGTKLVEKYPADATGFSNIAIAYFYARNFDKANEMGQTAVELKPKEIQYRFNLSWYALAASDFDVAIQQAQGMIEENPDFYEVYVVLALANLGQDNIEEATRVYSEMAQINPVGESLAALGLADIALYEGRLSEAIRILEERLDLDRSADQTYFQANKWSLMARARLMGGNNPQAITAADQALASGKDMATMFVSAMTYIQADQESKAQPLIDDLSGRLESEPKVYAKLLEGEIHRKSGRTSQAISLFQEAQGILDTWIGRCLLGKALINMQAWPDAHSSLDSCLTNKGEAASVFFDDTPTFHFVAQIYYYIGRAQEGLGSPAAADSYRKFLSIKEKADSDDPLIEDARNRLASLENR